VKYQYAPQEAHIPQGHEDFHANPTYVELHVQQAPTPIFDEEPQPQLQQFPWQQPPSQPHGSG
jgi:hypothetical protein